jgi:hypothetical protein
MPIDFKPLTMMELRSSPGEILDRVARDGEAFVVERSGQQMACLVPLSNFMPDIQRTRLNQELERLSERNELYRPTITDQNEIELRFASNDQLPEIVIRLPHGYPNACPVVFVRDLPDACPHRWQDGSLCIFGAMEIWNPGKHDVSHTLGLARRWLINYSAWKRNGKWGER